MIKSPKTIFLRIAGYVIKINFGPTDQLFLKEKMIKEVFSLFKGLILIKPDKKEDYVLNIIEQKSIRLFKKKTFMFLNFFEEKKHNKKIITYYHVDLFHISLILRYILEKLLRGRGFILHASACIINNKISVFLGKSGAGKSTAVRLLSTKYQTFADDNVAIKKEKDIYYVYQVPVFEKRNLLSEKFNKYPLGDIFFLKKSQYFKIEKIINKNVIAKMFLPQLFAEKEDVDKQVTFVLGLISNFKKFNYLYFAKNKTFLLKLFSKKIKN